MGQAASKVASRVVGTSSTKGSKAHRIKPEHIPSVPGKSAVVGSTITDPLTGFTRGTSPLTPSEERQRQFLETQQQKYGKGTLSNGPTGTPKEYLDNDKMSDELLNFLKDIGPVTTSSSAGSNRQQRPTRAPRITPLSEEESASSSASTNPSHDKSRQTTNMPLASKIPGYETSRTSSFSHTVDVVHPGDIGLDIVQFYGILTGKSSISNHLRNIPSSSSSDSAKQETMDQRNHHKQQELLLLENAIKYLHVPTLLKDTDGGYVGAYPNKVSTLLSAHRGMIELDPNRAKLVLQDLYDMEHERITKKTHQKRVYEVDKEDLITKQIAE
jgi:hypothetical protein